MRIYFYFPKFYRPRDGGIDLYLMTDIVYIPFTDVFCFRVRFLGFGVGITVIRGE